MSAGVVPAGGCALVDDAAGAEVEEGTKAVWVVVEVKVAIVVMSGSGAEVLAISIVRGVSQMA